MIAEVHASVVIDDLIIWSAALAPHQATPWVGQDAALPPPPLTPGAEVNSNGAGDAFIGGLVAALLLQNAKLSLTQVNVVPVRCHAVPAFTSADSACVCL